MRPFFLVESANTFLQRCVCAPHSRHLHLPPFPLRGDTRASLPQWVSLDGATDAKPFISYNVVSVLAGSMASPPTYMSFASLVALVAPGFPDPLLASPISVGIVVSILLHDSQLVRGTFVALGRVMSSVLRGYIELHPHAGRHVPGPLVFPRVVLDSLAIKTLLSPSPTSDFVGAHPLALSAHPVASPPSPSPTDWVVDFDSEASFHKLNREGLKKIEVN
jgi:hypothetical protein